MARKHRSIRELTSQETARFWSKVDIRSEDECWPWKEFCNKDGYGQWSLDKGHRLAPRVAYRLTYNVDPGQWLVTHGCDNPPCVNPKHLSLDTDAGNNNQKVQRGRIPRGEQHKHTHLTTAQVLAIRAAYVPYKMTYRALARQYGVHPNTIYQIIHRLVWGHI